MNERELLPRLKRGDNAAWDALLAAYQSNIYAVCYRMCGNAEDAQDAAQETFTAAWRGIDAFRGDAKLATWLYRLAVNASTDLLRRRRHSGDVSLDDEAFFAEPVDPAPQPQEAAERRELQDALAAALAALPAAYRSALTLREIGGLSYAEIAAALGTEEGTVKSRIHRARVWLRRYLSAEGNFFSAVPSKEAKKEGGK